MVWNNFFTLCPAIFRARKTNSPPLRLKDAHAWGNRKIEVCISGLDMAIAIIALILWENPVKQPLGTVTEILELFVQLQGFDFFCDKASLGGIWRKPFFESVW